MAEIDVHKRVHMVAFARVWRYRRSVHGSVFVGLMAISTSAP